ncbi:MAG: RluA family pseudouridine synthase [Cyanobacteriota bacterium]|nr:RluA family pseudouridine synthase [Cyanobacteriota bacterium]
MSRPPDPRVVHADPALLVVDKPSGLLSQPGLGPDLADAVVPRLHARWGPLQLVHRLDRDTSGLLLLARDAISHRALSRAFAERRVEKRYLADVLGCPAAAAGRIEQPLRRASRRPPRYRVDPAGRPSCTDWWLLECHAGWSRLELRPLTGRSHQLRVHLAWRGHPLLGDPLYGTARSRGLAPRLRLHACGLAFEHPVGGQRLELRSPAPWLADPPGESGWCQAGPEPAQASSSSWANRL